MSRRRMLQHWLEADIAEPGIAVANHSQRLPNPTKARRMKRERYHSLELVPFCYMNMLDVHT